MKMVISINRTMLIIRRIMTSFLMGFFILGSYAFAQTNFFFYNSSGIETVVGTIQDIRRNTIELYDETDKDIKRFILMGRNDEFHKGDRVRIYYSPRNNRVQIMKKMSYVPYRENGQNTGYIYKSK